MSLPTNVRSHPDKIAIIMGGSGQMMTYAELDAGSRCVAAALHEAGLQMGDSVAIMMETNASYLQVLWGILRSGMYAVTVNKYFTAEEAAHIVNDSEAKALFASAALAPTAYSLTERIPGCQARYMIGDASVIKHSYREFRVSGNPPPPRLPEQLGDWMLYSSGTTGPPRGVRRPLPGRIFDSSLAVEEVARKVYSLDENSIFLCPAPLYHSAPLCFSAATLSLGGTVVLMERYDAAEALRLVQNYRVTHGQWVPSMFVRMLKLPEQDRKQYDLSSQKVAVHGAAPAAIATKKAMIDWWGPILREYYGSTEFAGLTYCSSQEWLERPGTVGRAVIGKIHICDDEGNELPVGDPGLIYFERDTMPFSYYKDPLKTDSARHPIHRFWTQVGDIGYVDRDQYLFLTDRASFKIISGGVNIYPQEIEDVLIQHPAILDAAVFGLPDEEMGEQVKAVVELRRDIPTNDRLISDLQSFCRERLSAYKLPRTIDIIEHLPRHDSGKLYKRHLREQYMAAASAQ